MASFLFLFFGILIPQGQAATLLLSSNAETVNINNSITVFVRINSEDIGFNTAQAIIKFPVNILKVDSLDYSNSIFNFWLEEPSFSNETGEVRFIGGSTSGSTGKSLLVLAINFKVIGNGEANIVLTDGAITASDGSGTNILSTMNGIKIMSTATIVEPYVVHITRPAASAEKLPIKPVISVSLYPDMQRWYNVSALFLVSWQLPNDITDVATALNQNPTFIPTKSEGLFEGKTFPSLEDGIWHLHVRFKNSVGWGPTSHYRIAIDTVSPNSFLLNIKEGVSTDNPQPTLQLKSGDAASGIDHYEMRIDDGSLIAFTADTYQLPLQTPGTHLIRVRVVDRAGNGSEHIIELKTIPISPPVITFVNKSLFSSGDGFEMSGTAVYGETILFYLKQFNKSVAYTYETEVDKNGNWFIKIDRPFKRGTYFAEVIAKDERGALSLPVESDYLKSNVGGLNIWILVISFFLIMAVFVLLRIPLALLKKIPPLLFFRIKIEKGLAMFMGDKFRYYKGNLESLTKGFDYVQDHVIVTDPRANILYANKAVKKVTGFSPEEIIGKNPGDLWGGNMPEEFYQKMWHTIKVNKKPFVGKVKNKTKDGAWYWQELRISPILDENGEVKYFIGIEPIKGRVLSSDK